MSILRRALNIPHEERSAVSLLPSAGGRRVLEAPGYGMPGYGAWGPGMAWNSWTGNSGYVNGAGTTGGALSLSPVWACIRLLSEAIATLPLQTFTSETEGVREPYRPVPDYLLFQPPLTSRITYLSQLMLSLLTDGNAFVATIRDAMGVPIALFPLDPARVDVQRDAQTRKLVYRIMGETYDEYDVMHIPGMMFPGYLRGVSPLTAARVVIEGGLRSQEFFSSVMSNHAVPPAVIQIPGSGGTPEAERAKAEKVREIWQASHGGTNAGRIGVLTGGAELKSVAINPDDLEWLDARKFTVSEIARFYGVPPHLIADASNSTSWGTGLQEQNLAFGQFSLRPWVERIEDSHTRLLTTHGLSRVFIKLNIDALLRASTHDRYAAYAVGITNGFQTVNEVRKLEDLPPVDWGDTPGMPTPSTATADGEMTTRQLAEALQKIYLAVGVVITPEEAREILNREGAGLNGPGPTGGA